MVFVHASFASGSEPSFRRRQSRFALGLNISFPTNSQSQPQLDSSRCGAERRLSVERLKWTVTLRRNTRHSNMPLTFIIFSCPPSCPSFPVLSTIQPSSILPFFLPTSFNMSSSASSSQTQAGSNNALPLTDQITS